MGEDVGRGEQEEWGEDRGEYGEEDGGDNGTNIEGGEVAGECGADGEDGGGQQLGDNGQLGIANTEYSGENKTNRGKRWERKGDSQLRKSGYGAGGGIDAATDIITEPKQG